MMKIEWKGHKASLYVNGAPQPTLIVMRLLHTDTKGAAALFISVGSVARFSKLRVSE